MINENFTLQLEYLPTYNRYVQPGKKPSGLIDFESFIFPDAYSLFYFSYLKCKQMNTHTFIGHIGNDAIVTMLPSKQSVINFSVAITEKYTDGQGVKHENTTWVACSKFGEKTKVAEYLKQGTMVCITGIPSVECYQNKSGTWVGQLKCKVDTIDLLVTKQQEQKM